MLDAGWLVSFLPLIAAMAVAGLFAGILAGLFGIGGGIVIVPVLEAALGFLGVDPAIRMHIAVATSLATIIPTSIASSRAHFKKQAIDVSIVRRWGVFVVLGTALGAWFASQVDSDVLALVFACVVLLIALRTLTHFEAKPVVSTVPRSLAAGIVPLFIGAVSTVMGIGGGVMSVIALRLYGQPLLRCIGTAALLGLVIAVPGTLGMIVAGYNDPRLPVGTIGFVSLAGFVAIAPMTVIAAPFGAALAHKIDERRLQILFGIFLLIVAIRLFYRAAGT